MNKPLDGEPTVLSAEDQQDINLSQLKKSLQQDFAVQAARYDAKISALEAKLRKADIAPTFLGPTEPFVKSFDDHLEDANMTLERHLELVADSLGAASFTGPRPSLGGMAKSMAEAAKVQSEKGNFQDSIEKLKKSWADGDHEAYADMAKSMLGESGTPGAPGAWYHFLEENLSRYVQQIMLSNEDCTALQTIPTSITTNIVPEMGRLKSYGVGYGKHTMGFAEGRTAKFGGSQLMERLTHTLVQRGIRCAVTEMLLANKQKLLKRNPLDLERELRTLEWNLGKNHNLLYGDADINKDGSTVLEVDGLLKQMQDETNGYPDHVWDWDGTALGTGTSEENPLNIFRNVAEKLIINGHLPGGVVTGKYNVLMDFGVANAISTVVDDKQRIMVEKYEQAALMYGQSFSGFVTDLGVFRFRRSKTLHLTANDTWTADDDVSPHAITWPAIAPSAIPEAQSTNPKPLPAGNYTYRVSVVNDHGESDVSDSFVTTTEGTTPHAVDADEVVEVSIPYDAAFAGGTVNGYEVSPARYFLIYRGKAGETADADLKCVAKVPINGTSATTWIDYNQKIPGCTDMFFIPNDPMDLSHCSLTPPFEIPLYDINYGSTRQWMLMDIAGLCVWAPMRCFVVRNVPGFSLS